MHRNLHRVWCFLLFYLLQRFVVLDKTKTQFFPCCSSLPWLSPLSRHVLHLALRLHDEVELFSLCLHTITLPVYDTHPPPRQHHPPIYYYLTCWTESIWVMKVGDLFLCLVVDASHRLCHIFSLLFGQTTLKNSGGCKKTQKPVPTT